MSLDLPQPPEWMTDALCIETGVGLADAFFPDKGSSTREAKSVCAACPVAAQCLAYALDNRERFGVWGGLSERQRRRILTARERAA